MGFRSLEFARARGSTTNYLLQVQPHSGLSQSQAFALWRALQKLVFVRCAKNTQGAKKFMRICRSLYPYYRGLNNYQYYLEGSLLYL